MRTRKRVASVCRHQPITAVLRHFLRVSAQMRNLDKQKTAQGRKTLAGITADMTFRQIFISTILILTSLTSCGQVKNKSIGDKKPLDINAIKFIEIRNHHGGVDTVKTVYKRLNSSQTKIFIDKFNSAKSSGLYKYIVEYWVDVHLKDGTKRIFRVNSSNIKEDNDYCFDLGDKNYLKNLWATIK